MTYLPEAMLIGSDIGPSPRMLVAKAVTLMAVADEHVDLDESKSLLQTPFSQEETGIVVLKQVAPEVASE